ncbi:MAG: ArsR family transcriptional regulator [Candidatus Heimdallarchaeota archaeon]
MSQDVITYKQTIVNILTQEQVDLVYSEENYKYIIKFLRQGPRTVKELVEDFEKSGVSKSDKSIYRYLKELIENGFVAKAGKRITSKGADELLSETIYIRTAKIFLKRYLGHEKKKLPEKEMQLFNEIVQELLEQKFGTKLTSSAVGELINKLTIENNRLIIDIFENANKKTLEKLGKLNWDLIDSLIEYVGWLALVLDTDIVKEIEECCSK